MSFLRYIIFGRPLIRQTTLLE